MKIKYEKSLCIDNSIVESVLQEIAPYIHINNASLTNQKHVSTYLTLILPNPIRPSNNTYAWRNHSFFLPLFLLYFTIYTLEILSLSRTALLMCSFFLSHFFLSFLLFLKVYAILLDIISTRTHLYTL
jgi:hypothetical protein